MERINDHRHLTPPPAPKRNMIRVAASKVWGWTIDGRRRQRGEGRGLYQERAKRHANIDTVALAQRRAKAKAGRRQRVQQSMARRGKR